MSSSRRSRSADPVLRSAATTTVAAAVAFRLVDESTKHGTVLQDMALDGGGGEGDLWIERVCVYETTNGWRRKHAQLRSYFRNNRTGHVFPDRPPRGATNILPVPDEERARAYVAQQELQDKLDMMSSSSSSHHRRRPQQRRRTADHHNKTRSMSPRPLPPLQQLSNLIRSTSTGSRTTTRRRNEGDDDDLDRSNRTAQSSTSDDDGGGADNLIL